MTKAREFELEDGEKYDFTPSTMGLPEELERVKKDMHQAHRKAQQAPELAEYYKYRILAVDDNGVFLDSLHAEAERLKLHIETLNPISIDDTRNRILDAFENNQGFDFVLLDYFFENREFNGLDILHTLRPQDIAEPLAELNSKYIQMYYLPTAIVTRGGSVVRNDPYFNEKALGAGADKVYSEKGFGSEEIVGHAGGLSARPLLESLLKNGFKEMRFRAWARLWQNLRDQMEERIKDQLGKNLWVKDSDIDAAIKDVWKAIADPIQKAGYAAHLSMKILKYSKREKAWELHKMGCYTEDGCPDIIAWDALPLFKQSLSGGSAIQIIDELGEEHLGQMSSIGYPENLKAFERYLSQRAMAARLDSKEGIVGTFFITRENCKPPFSKEEQQNLKTVAERLGLFYRELRMRHRNHLRQLALVRLGKELLDEELEDKIVAKAVKVLHMHLHHWRHVFTSDPTKNPAKNGRVSIRLIEPGTGRLMRPDQRSWPTSEDAPHVPRWALGFGTRDKQPPKKIDLEDDRYKPLIELGKAIFYPDPKPEFVQEHRRHETHAKMLAPIKAGPVVVGTVNVEHKRRAFYGEHEKTSGDFALLQAVALEVGQALRALRARRMQRRLLELLEATGQDSEEQVIERLMGILYDYTGCAVGLWLKSSDSGWNVSQAWECQQGYFEDEPAPVNFKVDHKKPTNRLDAWRSHMTANFSRSLVGKLINGNLEKFDLQKDLVYYTETDNKPLGINARSEAVLALRDSASKELIGVFDLIFNQHPGLEFDRQRPLLEGAARFAGEYLSIRRRNRQYLTNSQIMRQQAALGDAYQQLRHSLKIHLMGLNGKLSRLLLAIENLSANQETAKSLAKKMQYILTQISSSIDMSKVLVNPPNPVDLDLSETWNAVREKLLSTAEKSGVDIPPMQDSVKVYLDHATLEMVFTNMLGNAFEAMATQETPRRVECVILPTVKPGFVRVSVRDTGPGVPDSIKSKLFKEIGVSQKSSGTGFQTYFSAFKLEQSGGHIEHDLDWKQGAGFLLTLPQTKESYQKIIKES